MRHGTRLIVVAACVAGSACSGSAAPSPSSSQSSSVPPLDVTGVYSVRIVPSTTCQWAGLPSTEESQKSRLMTVGILITLSQQGSTVDSHSSTANIDQVARIDASGSVSGDVLTLRIDTASRAKFGANYEVSGTVRVRFQGDSVEGTLDGHILTGARACRDCAYVATYVNCTAPDHQIRFTRSSGAPG